MPRGLGFGVIKAPRLDGCMNGTVRSLCDAFERHPQSPIREVRRNTAESYIHSFNVIRLTVAKRTVRALTPIDVKAWYDKWRSGQRRRTRAGQARP